MTAQIGRASAMPTDLRPGYSAWDQFCDWGNPYRRYITGGSNDHFILKTAYDRTDYKLYRLRADDTTAKLVSGLPVIPDKIFDLLQSIPLRKRR